MGLFLGISLLSFVEILEMILQTILVLLGTMILVLISKMMRRRFQPSRGQVPVRLSVTATQKNYSQPQIEF